uniref:Phosphatidate phosphatase PPAPDC1B-like n=1 Tax=Phallusia mammillata TaxID=59560 RepID=A0A6F9DQ83_9ASCI|nr:phosphatidate phosphatase PPAPDC1B-like [Phallusia mammillata]
MFCSFGKQRLTYILAEVLVRFALIAIFFATERAQPFTRVIQPEEWWLYKNPHVDKTTVSTSRLFTVAICSPIVTILLFSGIFRDTRNDCIPGLLSSTLALALNGVVTNAIKLSVGRPRPDFFFRCFPDGKTPEGQPSTFDLECTGVADTIIEGRKSFPSGHSSFAFVSLGFCALYMAGKLQCFNSFGSGHTWRLLTSLSPLLLAMLVGISRTCDYMHHWQDVVIGSLIGLGIAYLCYRQYYPPLCDENCSRPLQRAQQELPKVKSVHDLYDAASSSGPLLPTNAVKHM